MPIAGLAAPQRGVLTVPPVVSAAMASIETSKPRGSLMLAGADLAGGGPSGPGLLRHPGAVTELRCVEVLDHHEAPPEPACGRRPRRRSTAPLAPHQHHAPAHEPAGTRA